MGIWDDIASFFTSNTTDVVLQGELERFDFFLEKIIGRVRARYNEFNKPKIYVGLDFALDKNEKHVFINTGSRPIARIDIMYLNNKFGLILWGLMQKHHRTTKENIYFSYEKRFSDINSNEEDKIVRGIFEGLKKIVKEVH